MYNTIIANFGIGINFASSKYSGIIPYFHMVAYVSIWIYLYLIANLTILPNISKCPDVYIFSVMGVFSHKMRLFYTYFIVFYLVVKLQKLGKRHIGIFHFYQCCFYSIFWHKAFVDDNCRSFCFV